MRLGTPPYVRSESIRRHQRPIARSPEFYLEAFSLFRTETFTRFRTRSIFPDFQLPLGSGRRARHCITKRPPKYNTWTVEFQNFLLRGATRQGYKGLRNQGFSGKKTNRARSDSQDHHQHYQDRSSPRSPYDHQGRSRGQGRRRFHKHSSDNE